MATTKTATRTRKSDLIAASMSSLSGYLSKCVVAPGLPKAVDVLAKPAPVAKGSKAKAVTAKGSKAQDTGLVNGGKAVGILFPMLSKDDKGETYSKGNGGTYRYPARSAGSIINAAMAKAGKDGVTLADLVKAVTDADPGRYAANPDKAMDKVKAHAVDWLSRIAKAGTWQRKGDRYICQDAKAACINYRCAH